MAMSAESILASEMPFAKVVDTIDGEALLIGGKVFHVTGPDGNAADLFSIALRRMGRGDEPALSGTSFVSPQVPNEGYGVVGSGGMKPSKSAEHTAAEMLRQRSLRGQA